MLDDSSIDLQGHLLLHEIRRIYTDVPIVSEKGCQKRTVQLWRRRARARLRCYACKRYHRRGLERSIKSPIFVPSRRLTRPLDVAKVDACAVFQNVPLGITLVND